MLQLLTYPQHGCQRAGKGARDHPEAELTVKLTFVQTSPACPEQDDALDETGQQVGYLRLRRGRFRVDYPTHGGTTIYEARPQGDGLFEAEERAFYLEQAYQAIASHLARTREQEHGWDIVDFEDPAPW